MVLASSPDSTTIDELAQLADKVIVAAPPSVAAVTQPTVASEVDELRAEVVKLKETLSHLSSSRLSSRARSPSPYRPRPSSPYRPRTSSPRRPPRSHSPPPLCWYHTRFGDRARKCTPPCSYSGNSGASR